MLSHPMWVRGLKHSHSTSCICAHGVAPYVGAWIETLSYSFHTVRLTVAPYVGAWIETVCRQRHDRRRPVAPYVGAWIETWPCDLWLVRRWRVAPYVGAWIETWQILLSLKSATSHPMWVRGLKLYLCGRLCQVERGRTLCGCVD